MAYDTEIEALDDEGLRGFAEDEGEKWTEGNEEGGKRMPTYVRGAVPLPMRPSTPFRPAPGVSQARLQSRSGGAPAPTVQFDKPMVTQDAFNTAIRETKAEIASLAASIKKVNETLDKNTSVLDKKANSLNSTLRKGGQQSQLMSILPILLMKQPTIQEIALKPKGTSGGVTTYAVPEQKYKSDDLMPLLLVMMLGGMGSGEGTDNNMSMVVLAMALTGGFGKSN